RGRSSTVRGELAARVDDTRPRNEPYWLSVALVTTGFALVNVGRHGEALAKVQEAGELADRFGNPWLSAIATLWLGTLALWGDRPDDARPLLDEALDLARSTHSTTVVAMSLVGFARFALRKGDAEKAALLAGAAEGLRRA